VRERPVARAAILSALFFLAAISVVRLPITFTPRVRRAGLTVSLSLPMSGDPALVTTRWVAPIESAVRELGDVTGSHSRVLPAGATLDVRLSARADPEVKAARLLAELAPLRKTLPPDAQLSVWTSSRAGQQPAEVVALSDAASAAEAAEELRGAVGVRDVRTFGATSRQTTIRLRVPGMDADDVRSSVTSSLASRVLGKTQTGSRNATVRTLPVARDPSDAPIRLGGRMVLLAAIAEVTHPLVDPDTVARVDGRPAVLLLIDHDERVPLFTFARAVHRIASRYHGSVVSSEAGELAALLRRIAAALVAASIAFALLGWFLAGRPGMAAGLYFPTAVACTITMVRLTGNSLDAASLVSAIVAIAAAAPLAFDRLVSKEETWWPLGVVAAFGVGVPAAVACAPDPLPLVLAEPARLFAIATLCAIVAVSLLPAVGLRRFSAVRTLTRTVLRAAGSIVLFTIAASLLLFTYFGDRLDPRAGEAGGAERIYLRLTPPAGTTGGQTRDLTDRVERAIENLGEVARTWTFVVPGAGWITVDLRPAAQSAAAVDLLIAKIRASIPVPPSMVAIERPESAGLAIMDPIEERAMIAGDHSAYRFLLRGTDALVLRRTADSITSQLGRLGVSRAAVQPEWPPSTAQFELIPRPGVAGDDVQRIATELANATTPQPSWTLPDGTLARVVEFGAPLAEDEIPQRADVFGRTYDGATLPRRFDTAIEVVPGGVTRESGRFVLPVAVRVPGYDEQRDDKAREIDRSLSIFPVPSGVSIDRPPLDERSLSPSSFGASLLVLLLPLLIVAISSIVLASLRDAIVATAAVTAGVAGAAALLEALLLAPDSLALFAIGGTTFIAAAHATILLVRCSSRDRATVRALRTYQAPLLAGAVVGGVVPAIIAGTSGSLPAALRSPLGAAAAVIAIGTCAGGATPLALLIWRGLLRRRAARTAALTGAFAETEPRLVIRAVTKHYGRFRSLHRITFELRPGITALLGPNGAGKTTLLRIMAGLLTPSRGTVMFAGTPVNEVNLRRYQQFIGFLPQEFNAYPALSAIDFLEHWAIERGMADGRTRRAEVERVISLVGLEGDATRRVRDFSGGMRQRIGIARALLGDPRVLIVDEPTTGLDLESRVKFRALMRSLAAERIVILSTHIVSDVEAIASRLLVLARGELQWNGDMGGLIARAEGRVFDMIVTSDEARRIAQAYRLTRRVRVADGVRVGDGVRVRGIVPPGAALPGPPAEPLLEEAYLIAVGGDLLPQRTFAFLFETATSSRSSLLPR
jgi:ABC-type multidrug transport system ATPase subunit/multidrug efflux pump subunit AcrB